MRRRLWRLSREKAFMRSLVRPGNSGGFLPEGIELFRLARGRRKVPFSVYAEWRVKRFDVVESQPLKKVLWLNVEVGVGSLRPPNDCTSGKMHEPFD